MEEKEYKIYDYNFFDEYSVSLLMKVRNLEQKAHFLLKHVYSGREDKAGCPMFDHLKRVSESFSDDEEIYRTVGLLHDVVEDDYLTWDDLELLGYTSEIIDILKLLSRDKEVYPDYTDYITSIIDSDNEVAIKVKNADLLDNSNYNRLMKLKYPARFKLATKYYPELPRFENKLNELDSPKQLKLVKKVS